MGREVWVLGAFQGIRRHQARIKGEGKQSWGKDQAQRPDRGEGKRWKNLNTCRGLRCPLGAQGYWWHGVPSSFLCEINERAETILYSLLAAKKTSRQNTGWYICNNVRVSYMVLIYSFYHKGNARTMTINAMQNINPMFFFPLVAIDIPIKLSRLNQILYSF